MPSIEEAKKILKDYNKTCTEIELKDTAEWLEKVISACHDRVKKAKELDANLNDLISLQEQLRKTPINVETVAFNLSERVLKAQEFMKTTKQQLAESNGKNIIKLSEEYKTMRVAIPEFDKLAKKL